MSYQPADRECESSKTGAVKNFQRYTHDQRADLQASFRLTGRQRNSIGEVFWTHPLVPGIAFKTRKAALRAACEQGA